MSEGLPGPDLADLRCFLKVAETGSFSAAASALGLPKATLSRRVAALERHLGTQLLARTTRSVRCTAAGVDYARRAGPALAALLDAESGLVAMSASLSGPLRVQAPREFGEIVLAPLLADFQRLHPSLGLELHVGEEGGGKPAELRVELGGPPGPDRAAIGTVHSGLYASPDFIAGLGALAYAHELDGSAGLSADGERVWTLTDGMGALRLTVRPVLHTDSPRVVQEAAAAGLGVALLPTFLAQAAESQGRLRRLFPAWRTAAIPVHAVWTTRDGPAPKLRALLDHLASASDPAA